MLWKFVWSLLYLVPKSPVSEQPLEPSLSIPLQIRYHGPQSSEDMGDAYRALYSENDMILPDGFSNGGIRDTRYRWPGYPGGAVVPYEMDESFSNQQREVIERAMEQYHQHTCVRFVPKTSERDYVTIRSGDSCKSVVGRNSGEQELTLSEGCFYVGTIVHELGHTIGLLHEHQRSDRDSYLNIYTENINEGQEENFEKIPAELEARLTSFNYNSIMMYGNYAYSKQPGDLKTMESKNGVELLDPFSKPGLDRKDIEQVNKLYQCRV